MAGVVEEGAKIASGVVETYKNNPLTLAIIIMNIGLMLLLFYYMNRITTRTEVTLKEMYAANDKVYQQWGAVVKDTNNLTEKALHCILPDDALKLLQGGQQPPRPYGSDTLPAPPARPQNLRRSPVFKDIDIPALLFEPMKFQFEDSR